MEAERQIDTEPGGLETWRATLGGSIVWGRFKLFILLGIFLLVGGLIVGVAPIV
ncbi:hypothetical protein [Aureimonas sp. Leaf454]|uniref:hypothetical protein n=1 Tax=Aureimonas sp. Leaf454 TaxID=1736381 RepID=UPI000A560F79|nr:hypothetical protein [Aureimonas sp. Leaf454]